MNSSVTTIQTKKKTLNVQIFNSEISIKKCISMYAISCGELLKREDKQLTYFKFLFFIYIFMTFLLQFFKISFSLSIHQVSFTQYPNSHSQFISLSYHFNNLTFHSQMHSLILLIKEISINSETT